MRVVLVLLALLGLAHAAGLHWYVWTQATDTNGEYGFLNFYPKAITINPGDYVHFIQAHDTGIVTIVAYNDPAPLQFYTAGPDPCANLSLGCIALTQYAIPRTGGPMGNRSLGLTHVNSLDTFDYSGGFMASLDENNPQAPYTWTFFFDDNILENTTVGTDAAVTVYELLHVMHMQITITDGNVGTTPAAANLSASTQIETDIAKIPTIWNQTVAPHNNLEYVNGAWHVYMGAQATATSDGYGIGSFDRFLPFDTDNHVSTITINRGDLITFIQITPHAHSVSVYAAGHNFPPTIPSYNPQADTLTYPNTHFVPNPQAVDGIQTFTGTQLVVGAFLIPNTNATVRFDCPPGTYFTLCFFHEAVNMVGQIIVKAPGTVTYPPTTTEPPNSSAALLPLAALVAVLAMLLL